MRLFLERFLAADNEPLPNDETGISIGISAHLTLLTEAKRCARGKAYDGLPLGIANDQAMAASAFSGRIARVHPAGNHPQVPCLVFGEVEDPPLHPEGTLAIPPVAILAFCRLEVPQVLEDQNTGPLLAGELDNTSAHQMGNMLICVSDLAPEVDIVLFILGNDASLGSVTCNPSEMFLPKARYLSASSDKMGGEDGAFNGLDGADGEMFAQIEIDGADPCVCIGGDLLCDFGWTAERLFDGSVQPPLLPLANERRTSQLDLFRHVTPQRPDFDPGPAGSGPDFEHDG